MGAFDDLIPASQSANPGAFDDLIPAKPTGGLAAAAKQAIGSTIKGVGQAATDFLPGVTATNPISAYGQSVIDANPTATNSLGDIVESPWTATKEAVGNAGASIAGMLGASGGAGVLGAGLTAAAPFTGPAAPVVAGAGKLIANAGPFVASSLVAALPSYGGIRESQIAADPTNEADGKSKAIALLGAGAVGAIEGAFGPQAWARAAMQKGGIESIAKHFADAKSLPGAIGKGILKGGAIEGSEEIPQNVIEQVAGYRDPTTRQAIGETLLGGAMGAIGGGVLSGGMAGMAYRPKAQDTQPAAQPEQIGAGGPTQTVTADTTAAIDPVGNPVGTLNNPQAGAMAKAAATGEITGANEQKRQEQAIASTQDWKNAKLNTDNAAGPAAQVAQDAGQNASTAQAAAHAPLAVADAPTTGETNEEAQAGTDGAEGASVALASAAGIGGAGSPTGIAGVSTGAASGTAANLPGHVTPPIEQQQAIAAPQITPPAPAFPVTPAAPIANDQQAESDGAPTSSTTFSTGKGSSYVFHDDGTTTRNKAARPEHPGESGIQPRSTRTFFVTNADMRNLDLLQASWPKTGLVVNAGDGTIGVRYLEGPHAGKISVNTIVPFQTAPAVGLHPVESWGDGYTVHFGNAITSVNSTKGQQNGNQAEVAKPAAQGRPAQPAAGAGKGVAPTTPVFSLSNTAHTAGIDSVENKGKSRTLPVLSDGHPVLTPGIEDQIPEVTSQSPAPAGKPTVDKPFDSKAWDKARSDRIKASKASGNRHLDHIHSSVEGMRGLNIYNVHDPKERGKVRTVSNRGDVVVHWADEYSAKKNSASPITENNKSWLKTFGGQKDTFESWLSTSDLKDYVVGNGEQSPATPEQSPANTDVFLSSRTDDEIGDMSNHTNPKIRELGDAETARRSAMSPKSVSGTSKGAKQDEQQGISKGLNSVAQRQVNAADKFIRSVVEQFGLSEEDATKAWNYYLKNKLVSVDSVGGQYNLKDGRLWNGDSMREAAKQDDPTDRKADLDKRKEELLAKRKQLADAAGGLAAARPNTSGAAAKVDDAAVRMKDAAGQSVADRREKFEEMRSRFVAGMENRRQQAEAQHIEGKTAEPATATVIAESIAKGSRNTGTDLRKEHAALLAEIDAAIAKAPAEAAYQDTVTFDVPGDGKFKISNSKPRLEWFRAKIAAAKKGFSPETKRAAHKTPMQKIEGGMASDETIREMLKDGDLTAALELSKVVGRPMVFGARSDGGTPIIFTDAKPFIAAGLEKFGMASGRSFVIGQKAVAAWTVTDIGSGLSIASGDTRAKAEAAAKKLLSSVSQKDFHEASNERKKSGMAKDQATLEAEWVKWAEQAEYDKDHAAEIAEKQEKAKAAALAADRAKWEELTGEKPDFAPYARNPFDPASMNPVATLDDYEKARKNGNGDEFLDYAESKLDEDIAGHKPTIEAIRRLRSGNATGWSYLGIDKSSGAVRYEKISSSVRGYVINSTISQFNGEASGFVREDKTIKVKIGMDGEKLTLQQAMDQADKAISELASKDYEFAETPAKATERRQPVTTADEPTSTKTPDSLNLLTNPVANGDTIQFANGEKWVAKEGWTGGPGAWTLLQGKKQHPTVAGIKGQAAFIRAIIDADEAAKAKATPANTEDAGAELTYNRRNRATRGLKWEDISGKDEALRVKEATKAKVYPKPDYKAMIAAGMRPQLAHIVKQVYDSISASPKTSRSVAPSDEDIKNYIAGVNRVMDAVIEWANDSDRGGKWLAATVTNSLGRYASALDMMANAVNGEDSKSLLSRAFPGGYEPVKNELIAIGGNKVYGALQPGSRELNDAVKAIKFGWPESQESWQKQGITIINGNEVKAETSGADYGGEKKEVVVRFTIPNGTLSRTLKRVTVDGTRDPDSPEVRKVIDDGLAEFSGRFVLLNKAKTVVSTHATEDEAKAAARALVSRDGKKNTVSDKGISVTAAERIGEAKRLPGEDISSDKLREAFKFKGVNFGNWMKGDANEKERQLHLNHAYDSFMDLADVLGVPPEAMSLNGMLGVAIGAQGSGGFAAAHFVPGVNEINLTRESGAGSLAHEWGHALDHYFARQAGLTRAPSPFLTSVLKTAEGSEIRQEVLDKFKAIVQAMHKRPITQEEVESQRQEKIASAMRNLDGWMKSIVRGDLMDDAEVAKAIERIKSGDLGDGFVAAGRSSAVKPAIAEFGKIIKEKTGRVLQRTDLSAINSWATNLQYLQGQESGNAEHVPQQMVETQYSKDATSLDKEKGGKPYWSTTLEMFARAFDAFVSDTLEAKAAKNTYLSHAGRDGKTVPTGVERTAINAAIKGLVDTVETKAGEDGNVVLYNVATDTTATPADKAIYGMVAEGKTAAELLEFIGKASRRPFNRYLANALKNLGVLPTIKLDSMSGWNINDRKMAAKYAAAYNPKTDTIALFTAREAERHALHELTHAATLKAIAAGGPASVQMRGLFLYLQRNGSLAGQYGMSNLDEFVAEAFSNPKFQAALKAIPAPNGSTLKSAWQWFVRAVRTALGMKSAAMEMALDRAMTVGAQLMRENVRLNEAAHGDSRYAIAWHGTPHVWAPEPGFPHGRPRLDKIGTGEGMQAYGFGWYSAQMKDVASEYQRNADGMGLSYDGKKIKNTIQQEAAKLLYENGGDKDAAKKDAERYAYDNLLIPEIERLDPKKISIGNLYQLDIPDSVMPNLLDWDKPMSEQPVKVRAAVKSLVAELRKDTGPFGDESQFDLRRSIELSSDISKWKGFNVYRTIAAYLGSDKAASEKLAQAGVTGNRYLDGQSRSNGAGTYNYVLWDQPTLDKVALLERNGKKLDAIREADAVRYSRSTLHDTITINGIERPTTNSNGKPIAQDEDGLRRFWEWFGTSAVVDEQGRPLVVYHGTRNDLSAPKMNGAGLFFVTPNIASVSEFADGRPGSQIMPMYASIKKLFDTTDKNAINGVIAEGRANGWVKGDVAYLTYDTGVHQISVSLLRSGDYASVESKEVVSAIKKAGFDGLKIVERGRETLAVFKAEQIKSATGNIGEFSPTNQDIRYNVATDWYDGPGGAPVRNAWQAAKAKAAAILAPKTLDKIIYELQDKFIDLKNLREHIRKIGGTITDMNDAYLGEELYHKRLAYRTERFQKDELLPLLEEAKAKGISKDALESFLHARHAPEANAAMAKRNPNQAEIDAGMMRSGAVVKALETQLQRSTARNSATAAISKALNAARGELAGWKSAQAFRGAEEERTSLSGMSDADAAALMGGLAPDRRAALDSLAYRIDEINQGTINLLESYGLMSKESLAEWRKAYKHYVPLHRDEAHPDSFSHPIGQGFSTKGDAAKRRTGSNQKVTNILGHIAMQREAALTRGEKNLVMRKLYLMARQNPLPDVWKIGPVPMIDTIDKGTGFVMAIPDPLHKTRPNVLVLRIAGKDVSITFNEHNPEALRMAHALKNLDVDDLHYMIPVVGKMTRWFASINTQYNPIFGVVNLLRDTQEAAINLSSTELAGKQGEILKDQMSILKAVLKNKGRMPTTGPWAALFDEFNAIGGSTGFRDLFLDAEARSKALQDTINSLDQGNVGKAWDAVAGWLSDYNEAMENSTRLAAYKAGIDSGMSKERAASLAKNLTVNFNRKGRQTRELGALYAFFNAAVQGTARMAQTLTGPSGRKIMAGGVMLGAMNAMIAIAAMGGGNGDDDEWEKIPEFVKENSFIIPIGKSDYISIPMPLGFKLFPNIGRLAAEMAWYKDKTAGKQLASLFTVLADAFNPLGGSSPPMQIIAPTVLDPFVALAQNRDWTGKPIYIENRNSLDPSPGMIRSKESATPWAKWFAGVVNGATGGTEYTPGGWSPTPDQIDFVIGQLTGGVGREAGKIASTVAAPLTGEELPPHKIPLLGRFYGSTEGQAGQSEKFYENITLANEAENEIKGRAKAGLSAVEYIKEHPGANVLAARGNVAERQVAALRKMRRAVVARDLPGSTEKVLALNERIALVMTRFNREAERLSQ